MAENVIRLSAVAERVRAAEAAAAAAAAGGDEEGDAGDAKKGKDKKSKGKFQSHPSHPQSLQHQVQHVMATRCCQIYLANTLQKTYRQDEQELNLSNHWTNCGSAPRISNFNETQGTNFFGRQDGISTIN